MSALTQPRPLVVAELHGASLAPTTAHAVHAAATLGPVTLLVAGHGCQQAAEQGSTLAGVVRVLLADGPTLAHGLAENLAPLLVTLVTGEGFSHLLAPAGTFGRELLPRAAALLGVPALNDVVAIADPTTLVRPIHAGGALATVAVDATPVVFTARASAFAACGQQAAPAPIIPIAPPADCGLARHVAFTPAPGERPDLATARVVVTGGLGVGDAAHFALLERLADRLGGAVGATRSAVDAGLAPNDWQVGQTGKIIGPDLYIGVGVSGAIQHLAGIKDARLIVAINNDPAAPLFSAADLGLVADLREALPQLLALLEK